MLLLAASPVGPALAEGCAVHRGAVGVGHTLCIDGRAVVDAAGTVAVIEDASFAGVRFVRYDVADSERAVVISQKIGEWSFPLPSRDEIALVGPNEGETFGAYRLLALKTPMLTAWRDALAQQGVSIHGYVPTNTFLVHAPGAPEDLLALPFVRALAGFAPSAKIQPGLLEAGGRPLVNVLSIRDGPGAYDETLAALAALGADVTQQVRAIDRVTARLDAAQLPALAATPGVMWIDRAGEGHSNDMDIIRELVGAERLAQLEVPFTGAGVIGMVVDSGTDIHHADLSGSLLAVHESMIDANGNLIIGDHGTSAYGVVFGAGIHAPPGMAPGAKGVAGHYDRDARYNLSRDLRNNWNGVFQSHSNGHRDDPLSGLYDAYSRENDNIVHELDVLVLQSMANEGPGRPRAEAMAKNILAVGGIYHRDTLTKTDDDWKPLRTDTSTRPSTGPAADGRIKPELVGPADFVLTAAVNNGTRNFGGTSAATPVISGAVALVHEMWTSGVFGGGGVASPALVKALLIATASPYAPHQVVHNGVGVVNGDPPPTHRDVQGWGLPDLATLYGSRSGVLAMDEGIALATGEAATYAYSIPLGARAVHVSLVWTDPPGEPFAARALVNDLDLRVEDASGTLVYHGNFGLREGTVSPAGGSEDRLHNVENVFIPSTVAGPLRITVRAAGVAIDAEPDTPEVDQRFALVALGIV